MGEHGPGLGLGSTGRVGGVNVSPI
jgi:hypothetical protein